jgi:dipeptidyl aminopeptidase/acylaminoacyl peptidase
MCGTLGVDGQVDELWAGDATVGTRYVPKISPTADGSRLVAVKESAHEPPEVVELVVERAGEGWRRVSSLNEELARVPVPEWQRFAWQAADGLEVEGLLALPREREPDRLPLLVLVHGGPTASWTWQFTNFGTPHLFAEAGYAVLMPNPRGSAGRGQDFARANLGDLGGGDLQDILAGVEALVDAGIVDTERVGVYGGSYGGFMAAWAVTQTDRFAASVPMACCSNWLSFHNTTNIGRFDELFLDSDPYDPDGNYFRLSPIAHARKVKTPTLIIHGEVDLCTPLGQAQELYQALVEAGVETELVVYPREGHGWHEWDHQIDVWNRMRGWFDRHLLVER